MILSKKRTQKSLLKSIIPSWKRSGLSQSALDKSYCLGVITHYFPPDYAATGQLVDELVRQLGHKQLCPRVFTGQPGYASFGKAPEWEKDGAVVIRRSKSGTLFPQRIRGKAINGLLFAIRAFLHLVKNAKRYELLLVTTAPPFLPVVGYLANLLFGIPYVCLLYDLYPDIAVELKVIDEEHFIARAWRWLNCKVWQRASGIIVLSPSMKQRVAERCPDLDEQKISIIHSWSDPQKITPRPKSHNWFALKYHLVNPFVVLYSGNMGRCHDIDTLFEAAKKLQDLNIQFVCIGDGAKRKALQEDLKGSDIENFLFLPYQSKSDLPYSLTACDLSIVSVENGVESLVAPSKLYSAMAAGRPIAAICPPTSYLNPLLNAAQCGKAFANGDADGLAGFIRELIEDRQRAGYMGRLGREYMQAHFTPGVIADQYVEALQEAKARATVLG